MDSRFRVFTVELFFFKQMTAYERRISDWSSDVCSSDLHVDLPITKPACRCRDPGYYALSGPQHSRRSGSPAARGGQQVTVRCWIGVMSLAPARGDSSSSLFPSDRLKASLFWHEIRRSEEHTSELQSLMRISYAVFCLKTNITKHTITLHIPTSKNT